MIVVLVVVAALSWLKQKVARDHFKNGACEGLDVSGSIVLGSNNNFRRTILPRLNLWCKVMVSPATISHVANFDLNVFIYSRSSFVDVCNRILLIFRLLN
jgi:hypothetical protein